MWEDNLEITLVYIAGTNAVGGSVGFVVGACVGATVGACVGF